MSINNLLALKRVSGDDGAMIDLDALLVDEPWPAPDPREALIEHLLTELWLTRIVLREQMAARVEAQRQVHVMGERRNGMEDA